MIFFFSHVVFSVGFDQKVAKEYVTVLNEKLYKTLPDLLEAPVTKQDMIRYGIRDDKNLILFEKALNAAILEYSQKKPSMYLTILLSIDVRFGLLTSYIYLFIALLLFSIDSLFKKLGNLTISFTLIITLIYLSIYPFVFCFFSIRRGQFVKVSTQRNRVFLFIYLCIYLTC